MGAVKRTHPEAVRKQVSRKLWNWLYDRNHIKRGNTKELFAREPILASAVPGVIEDIWEFLKNFLKELEALLNGTPSFDENGNEILPVGIVQEYQEYMKNLKEDDNDR